MKHILTLSALASISLLCANEGEALQERVVESSLESFEVATPLEHSTPEQVVEAPVEKQETETLAVQAPEEKQKPTVQVLVPQKDLESAIKSAKKGDVLVYDGASKWYTIEGKTLQSGTRVYVLGEE